MTKSKAAPKAAKPSVLSALLQQAQDSVDYYETDLSEVSTGGGGRVYPEGYAFARLVSYVEFGKQPREFQGQAKDPVLTFRLGFAIWGQPPGQEETYHNADGTPGYIGTFDMYHGNNSKASTKVAFDKMNWTGKHKQFFTMLGEPFLLRIKIKEVDGEGGKKRKVNRLDLKETLPPRDPATGAAYPVPEVEDESMYRLFLWNNPTVEGWDSLFIEGQSDEGKSKNWMQEKCYEAVDFEGSALHQLLSGGAALPSLMADDASEEAEEEPEQEEEEQEEAAPTPPAPPAAPAKPAKAPAKAAAKPAAAKPATKAGAPSKSLFAGGVPPVPPAVGK